MNVDRKDDLISREIVKETESMKVQDIVRCRRQLQKVSTRESLREFSNNTSKDTVKRKVVFYSLRGNLEK